MNSSTLYCLSMAAYNPKSILSFQSVKSEIIIENILSDMFVKEIV
jgi:hypothetical protein